MDETAGVRDLQEQVAGAGQQEEPSYAPVEGWRDLSGASPGLTQYELGLLHSQMAGHRWHAWRRLNGYEDYFAACSCGWRSAEVDSLRQVLDQVRDHLKGIQVSRGGRPSPWAAKPPARDEREAGTGQRGMPPAERPRELRASVRDRQERMRQALGRSGDLMSASEEQADRRVAELKHAVTHVTPKRASARRAEALQSQLDRAKELRKGIIAAAAALAVIAEEVAWINQDLQSRHPSDAAEHQRLADEALKSAAQAHEVERAFSD